jgi:hypothetical protein
MGYPSLKLAYLKLSLPQHRLLLIQLSIQSLLLLSKARQFGCLLVEL